MGVDVAADFSASAVEVTPRYSSGLTFERLQRAYGFEVIDYGPWGRDPVADPYLESDWLLLAIGAGLMMSVMDAVPRCRWAIDLKVKTPKLSDWLTCAERVAGRIVVAAWFSVSNPEPLRAAIAGLRDPSRVLCYVMPEPLGVGTPVQSIAALKESR